MDILSKKLKTSYIYLNIIIGVIIYWLSYVLYGYSNSITLTSNPIHPYKPPFDNIWVRMGARELMIWLMFVINILALRISKLSSYKSLLFFITLLADIVTLVIAFIRIKFDNEILFQLYSNTLGFLVSAMPYTIIVLLSLIPNEKTDKSTNN